MKKILTIVLIVTSLVGILWRYQHPSNPESIMVLYGNVDIREVNLGFRVAGKLSTLRFDEGDTVQVGEVIAQLDSEPYQLQVANASASVKSLKALLKLKETGNRPQEIAQAKAQVLEQQAAVTNTTKLLQRAEKMHSINGISDQDLDNAKANAQETAARLSAAQQKLDLLEAGFRTEDIAQTKANITQAEATLASAELQVKDTILTAPSAGVILTRAQEVGAILPTGATIFTLSLQKPVWIRAYIHEVDMGKIHPGTVVDVYTDSRPDKPYRGQVGFISPRSEFTPKTVETTQLRTSLVYRLRIVVENPDESLRQGMPVTIKLSHQPATERATNSL